MSETTPFRARVAAAVRDLPVVQAVHHATFRKVEQRAAGMAQLRDHEALRTLAAQIKQHTLERLGEYLDQFVAQVQRLGATVHVAADAAAARQIITAIAQQRGARLAVKVKSMTTEEVHLNEALQAAGVATIETDLGEFIVQLDRDRPSHIVTPIIHKDRRQVGRAMQRELGIDYTEDPAELTAIARAHLRDKFRRCDLGISGVNFGIAETGTICICTNEGNGRMSTTRPRTHVALMGIEKLIPRMEHLAVFLKLLSRSSTGQPMTVYTSLINGPRRPADPDGPDELHIVLLDNGRAALLGGPYEEVLRCIRCGACLNACPVYRNIGGHAYNSVYPGPIGALVTPLLAGHDAHAELPRASSLCGACGVACPVKIDIPHLLVMLRAESSRRQPVEKRWGMWLWSAIMQRSWLYRATLALAQQLSRPADGWLRRGVGPVAGWTAASRDLPLPALRSFRDLWNEELRDER